MRLDIRRIGALKKGDEVIGNETRVKVVKNKVAPPFKQAVFDIMYNEGISRESELIELGVEHDIVAYAIRWPETIDCIRPKQLPVRDFPEQGIRVHEQLACRGSPYGVVQYPGEAAL